jgi:DNA-binding PucR family transcriptional regulator
MSAPSRAGSGVRDADGGPVRAAIGEVARTLATELTARTAELEAIFLDQIPEVRGDEAIQELMVASTSSNLSVMFDALRHGIRVDQIDVPAPAAAYAQRFAQRGLPLEALLRAYRLGDHRFIQWFMRGLTEHARTPAELEASASAVVAFTVEYVDRISEALVDIYREERQLWGQRTEAARAAQIRAVLNDRTMDEPTAEIMTGRAMNRWHVGLIVWVERGGDVRRQMDAAAPQLRDAHADAPLIVPADDHTLWVWYGAQTEAAAHVPDLSRVLEHCPDLRVAVGEPARHLAGFRATHREASRAQAVAGTAAEAGRVTRFAQVRLSALLSENLGDLRSWVHRTLGDLAVDDDATGRLRETVRTLLECGGSYVDTAEHLHIHRNTVRYRLQRAEEVRGRSLSSDRIDLEVALVACHQLGASVLRTPKA